MASKHNIVDHSKPILITGGAGYIGSHVIEKLLKHKFKVRLFDRLLFGEKSIEEFRTNRNFQFIQGDISQIDKLLEAMDGCEVVIHMAGLVGDPASAVNENLTRQINIISTRSVKECAKLKEVKLFIFASSCSVYGSSDKVVDESSKLNPVSLYARSKIDSEQELLDDQSDGFHPVVLRFATVFGHSRRPRFDLVANLFVAQAFNEGVITVTGSNQWRPFIHPKDIAEAMVRIIKTPLVKVSHQIYNVGDEQLNVTIGELAGLVGDIVKKNRVGKNVEIIVKDDFSDRRNYKVSFDKIKKTLNFRAMVNLAIGLKEIHDNFKQKKYKTNYRDPIYVNVEVTKRLNEDFTV